MELAARRRPRAPGARAAEVWERAQLQVGAGRTCTHSCRAGALQPTPPRTLTQRKDPLARALPFLEDAGLLCSRVIRHRPSSQSSGSQDEPTDLWTQLFSQSS